MGLKDPVESGLGNFNAGAQSFNVYTLIPEVPEHKFSDLIRCNMWMWGKKKKEKNGAEAEEMMVLEQSILISNLIPSSSSSFYVHSNLNNGRRGRRFSRPKNIIVSKKDDGVAKSGSEQRSSKFPLKRTLAQVGIGVLSLGFIDAGYSGDWSRIGVISTETEDLLKAAAFLVAPLCAYLIYLLSKRSDVQ